MRKIEYEDAAASLLRHLRHGGAFLNVGIPGEKPNTMTIGWAQIGWMWKHPSLAVLVRPSRYTYPMINRAGAFTVSVPGDGALRKELAFAGAASGRDTDKFSGHGLTALPAQSVPGVIVAECPLHIECRTRYVTDMVPGAVDEPMRALCYPEGDYHRFYFGEIVNCYEI